MRAGSVFFDTNVILYIHDKQAGEKSDKALAWLRAAAMQQKARINLQVLNELTSVLVRKNWFDTREQIFAAVDQFSAFGNTPLTARIANQSRPIFLAHQLSWWDCLLLASAIDLGCTHFLSEDLQDGQTIEGLTIVSPFAHTPDQILFSR
jgi:predicted nucleic acid-binding protein